MASVQQRAAAYPQRCCCPAGRVRDSKVHAPARGSVRPRANKESKRRTAIIELVGERVSARLRARSSCAYEEKDAGNDKVHKRFPVPRRQSKTSHRFRPPTGKMARAIFQPLGANPNCDRWSKKRPVYIGRRFSLDRAPGEEMTYDYQIQPAGGGGKKKKKQKKKKGRCPEKTRRVFRGVVRLPARSWPTMLWGHDRSAKARKGKFPRVDGRKRTASASPAKAQPPQKAIAAEPKAKRTSRGP